MPHILFSAKRDSAQAALCVLFNERTTVIRDSPLCVKNQCIKLGSQRDKKGNAIKSTITRRSINMNGMEAL